MDKPWLKFYDPDVPQHVPPYPKSFSKILEDTADRFSSKPAVFFFGGRIKYGLLRAQADQFARALLTQGFRPGYSLGLLLPNMPQTIISLFGTLKAGGKIIFFDPLAGREELRDQLNETGIGSLIILDLVYSRIQSILPQTRVKRVIVTQVKDYLPFPKNFFFSMAAKGYGMDVKLEKSASLISFKEFLASGRIESTPPEESPLDPAEFAVFHYGSGTEGAFHGVAWTQANLIANVLQATAWLGKVEMGREVFLSVLPCHQPEGLILGMILPIFLGALSVQLPQFDIGRAMMMIKKHRVSFFPVTPSIAESIANRPLFNKKELSSIRTIWSVGSELSPEIVENLEKKISGKVIASYGPSEAMALTHATPLYGKRKPGSIGIPLPGTEVKIIDPAHPEEEIPLGKKGELMVKGPQVMAKLVKGANGEQKALPQDWLPTGDLARMDEDGFFYIMGRVKEKGPWSTDRGPP